MNPRNLTTAELLHAIADLNQVIEVQERMRRAGHPARKLETYWDHLYACAGELQRRTREGVR